MNKISHLDLRATNIGNEGIKKLVNSKNIEFLEYFDISNNHPKIDDDSLIHIANSENLGKIYNLEILKVLKTDEN